MDFGSTGRGESWDTGLGYGSTGGMWNTGSRIGNTGVGVEGYSELTVLLGL